VPPNINSLEERDVAALRRPRPVPKLVSRPAHIRQADGHPAFEERGDFTGVRTQEFLFAGLSNGYDHRRLSGSLVCADTLWFQEDHGNENGWLDRQHDAFDGGVKRPRKGLAMS
jgi:hypothetical protein